MTTTAVSFAPARRNRLMIVVGSVFLAVGVVLGTVFVLIGSQPRCRERNACADCNL